MVTWIPDKALQTNHHAPCSSPKSCPIQVLAKKANTKNHWFSIMEKLEETCRKCLPSSFPWLYKFDGQWHPTALW